MSLEKYCILGNRHISILPASISSAILQVVCICNLFIVNVNKYSLRLKGSKSSKTIHYQAVLTYLAHPYMGLSPLPSSPREDVTCHVANKHGFGRLKLDYS